MSCIFFVDDASANPTFYADFRNPQSLNKYQYTYYNPLRLSIPYGHNPEELDPGQLLEGTFVECREQLTNGQVQLEE